MAVVVNTVRRGFYLDSVALMRVSKTLSEAPGVEEAAIMMGTPANKAIMSDAGVLDTQGEGAQGGDLVVALRAINDAAGQAALETARELLYAPRALGEQHVMRPRGIAQAVSAQPDATLALISVPGEFAAAEARKALHAGLDVMIFSDNVTLEDEAKLKVEARKLGRMVMGPDCGTAIIGGVPLAFANVVERGDIAIVGASGTGIQEVSCLISRGGSGISHAIGVGGRDLSESVGGITTLMALDLLERDAATRHIVLVSKPPAPEVTRTILARVAASKKSFTLCLLGSPPIDLPANASQADTLEDAAFSALGQTGPSVEDAAPGVVNRGALVGLFVGGTLCAEAQCISRLANLEVSSNAPIPGVSPLTNDTRGHRLIDYGDDEHTRGKPHPMIDPEPRDQAVVAALRDESTGVVLVDLVIGHGSHADPAGALVDTLSEIHDRKVAVIASVTGTENDPQHRLAQKATLERAGIHVARSNAAAARLALECIGTRST